jgi:hypothetical protein
VEFEAPAVVKLNGSCKQPLKGQGGRHRIRNPLIAAGEGHVNPIVKRDEASKGAFPAEKEGPDGIKPRGKAGRGKYNTTTPGSIEGAAGGVGERRGCQKVGFGEEGGQARRKGKVKGRGREAGGEGGNREGMEDTEEGDGQVDKRNKGGGGADELKGFPAGEEGGVVIDPTGGIEGQVIGFVGAKGAEPGVRVGGDTREGVAEGKDGAPPIPAD